MRQHDIIKRILGKKIIGINLEERSYDMVIDQIYLHDKSIIHMSGQADCAYIDYLELPDGVELHPESKEASSRAEIVSKKVDALEKKP